MKIRILDRWDMELPEPTPGDPWFLDWVVREPTMLGKHLAASWEAYSALARTLDTVNSVIELFGGIGGQGLMVEELFPDLLIHSVSDYSLGSVAHLKGVLPGAHVSQMDAYRAVLDPGWDVVGLDFGDLTARWTLDGEQKRILLDRVFATGPSGVVLTDVAGPYLHLQQGVSERILGDGAGASYPTYLEALQARLEELYGYVVAGGGWHRGSAVMALVPYHYAKGELVRIEKSAIEVLHA